MSKNSGTRTCRRIIALLCIFIFSVACVMPNAEQTEVDLPSLESTATPEPSATPEPTEEPCPVYLGMPMDEMFDAIGPYEVLYWPDKEWGEYLKLQSFVLQLADGRSLALELVELDPRVGEEIYGYYYYDTDGKLLETEAELLRDMERIPVGTDTSFILQDHLLTFSQLIETYGLPFPMDSTAWKYRYYTEDMCVVELVKEVGENDPFYSVYKIDLKTQELVERAFFEYYWVEKTIVYHYDTHLRLSAFDWTTGEQIGKVVYERDGDTYRLLSAEGVVPIHTDLETLKQFKNLDQIKEAYGEPHFDFHGAHAASDFGYNIPFEDNNFGYFTDNYGVAEVYLDESGNLAAVAYWNVNAEGEEEFEYYMY